MQRLGHVFGVIVLVGFAGCSGNQATSPSPNSSTAIPTGNPLGPLTAAPLSALPEGGRLVSLGETVDATVSVTDPICRDGDPQSDVNDPCQRFYVRAIEDGILYLSVSWEPSGDWLSLRAQNKYPVLTGKQSPIKASATVVAGSYYAFEVGMHGADVTSQQRFTFLAYQP